MRAAVVADVREPRGVVEPLEDLSPWIERHRKALIEADAFAVCLLHAFANPAHEARVAEILRAALPGVGCLLVSPLDRAEKNKQGKLVTRPVVKRIVAAQREVALKQGCAFWNTWRAMGGEGSMARWYKARPPLGRGDLTHPTWRGAQRVGAMFFAALMRGYREALAQR